MGNDKDKMLDDKDIMLDENDEIITMNYDDGTSENFYCLAELDYKNKWYAYLEPVDPDDDYEDGEVYVYEIGEDEKGEEIFLPVDDEKLLNELVDLLNKELNQDE